MTSDGIALAKAGGTVGVTRTLAGLLDNPLVTLEEVALHLDALDPLTRVRECRGIGRRKQRLLYEVARGGAPMSPDDLVRGAGGDAGGAPVPWYGRNSLPLFTLFEKHFRRFEGQVVGYNRNPWYVNLVAGPGYFVVRATDDARGPTVIDYTLLPARTPPGWPALEDNLGITRRLVYGHMNDYCRRVTDGVLISEASRKGRPMGQYFILCRG